MAEAVDQLVIGEPCDPTLARPLHVVAALAESLVCNHAMMLDGLLAWVAANEGERRLPPRRGESAASIEIPIIREPGGRFHLCSEAFGNALAHDLRHLHRRPPWHEMARLGSSKITRVDIGGGANKSLRIPYEAKLTPQLEWWCLGDPERIRSMLTFVHYLGDRRGHGHGKLDLGGEPWRVEECEPWHGFPVVQNGNALRPLPPDWPGLEDPPLGYRVLTPPYFDVARNQLCAVPGH